MKTTKIRWVIAHEPLHLFVRAAEDFQAFVNAAQSAEKIEVEIMTLGEYSQRYNNGVMLIEDDLLDLIQQGRVEMSQMYTTWLAEGIEHDMLALEMPFIFEGHDHAARVLEGAVGEGLLEKITEKSNVRGLAFTYSGGFRNIIANKQVDSLKDLVTDMTLRTNRNPVAQETFRAIGVNDIFICEIDDLKSHIEKGDCEGGESVYSRVYPLGHNEVSQTVIDSKHSLFLTTMLMNNDFWNSLSAEVKAVIKDAAIQAGRREREVTIAEGDEARERLIKDQVKVLDLSDEEIASWKQKVKVVYDKFEPTFTPGLIEAIRKA